MIYDLDKPERSQAGVKPRGRKPGKEVGTDGSSISLPVWPISDGPNQILSRSNSAVRTREGCDAAGAARHSERANIINRSRSLTHYKHGCNRTPVSNIHADQSQ